MLVHSESQSLLLKVRTLDKITSILPKYKPIDYDGHNLAIPHRLDEVKILRNIGIQAPSPILYYYKWPGPPHKPALEHQRLSAAFLTLHSRAFCFNEPGTAKTATALWAADYLMNQGIIRKVLVVAPNSSIDITWMEEIFGFLMHRQAALLVGSKERRLKLLATDSHFYVINHEGLEIIAPSLRSRSDIDLVIGDECDVWKNSGTDLYKNIEEVTRKRRVWLLSGTPVPNSPTDAWALARLVNRDRVPTYFSQWRRQTMYQVSQYKWLPRVNSYELAYQAMQPAIRYRKKDCFDLPPMITTRRQAELTAEQKKAMTQLRHQAAAELKQGIQVTAVNAADKITKMRQVLCGVVKAGEEQYIEIDHKPRVALLMQEIAKAVSKVIIIVPFKGIIRTLEKEIVKQYTVEIINGDVARAERTNIIKRFKDTKDPHILLCHPKVMSHSLNLAEAATLIFYGPIYSNGQHQQVIERIARPDQKHDMTIARIGCHPLEWQIYADVDAQRDMQASILAMYKHYVLEES